MTRFVLDIDDSQWKADHLPRVLRTTESEWLNELACQVEIQIADARPLIVLDLRDADPDDYFDGLRWAANATVNNDYAYALRNLADQIEAQTQPAKIEEPPQGKRVEANLLGFPSWNEYLHIGTLADEHWVRLKDGNVYAWDLLTNPEVVTS
jgi:hypothetical protein